MINFHVLTEDGSSYGATLCEVLVKAYDQIPITTGPAVHPSKHVVVSALKALLAVSSTAKDSALTGLYHPPLAFLIRPCHT